MDCRACVIWISRGSDGVDFTRIVKNAKCPVLIYKRVVTPTTPAQEKKAEPGI